MSKLKMPTNSDLQNALERVLDFVISTDHLTIETYVKKLLEQNKGISSDELAKKYYIENL